MKFRIQVAGFTFEKKKKTDNENWHFKSHIIKLPKFKLKNWPISCAYLDPLK